MVVTCECKPMLDIEFTSCVWETKFLRKTLIYYPSNSKKGIPIKGTNLRVGFRYLEYFKNGTNTIIR